MKYAALMLMLVASAPAQLAKPAASISGTESLLGSKASKISRAAFTDVEKRLDGTLPGVGTVNEPLDMLGPTRGLYLEGYGAVFTTELSLLLTPTINPFNRTISPETVVRVHQRKLERLPLLRKAMREMLRVAGASLTQLPEDQQIVVAVRLDYLGWEDTQGMPSQILMRADRRTALTTAEIKTEEF